MGDVEIADQIRGTYRIDKWMRKYKWWYAIFWWGFQVLMVNSYVCYKSCMEEHGLNPISHYEFQKFIARAFIAGQKSSQDKKGKETTKTVLQHLVLPHCLLLLKKEDDGLMLV